MELRRNHQKNNVGVGIVKMIIFALILIGTLYWVYMGTNNDKPRSEYKQYEVVPSNSDRYNDIKLSYLPSSTGELVYHKYYTLSYIEKDEQAEWVAYELTQDLLRIPNVKRSNRFNKDPLVSTASAGYYDYRGSGYTRGHLAPAGDMAFSQEAMEESFYMSNISPQIRAFNNGIWKELEEQVRDWVYHNDHLYIVTGPILKDNNLNKIKKEQVSIPNYFYKVLLSNIGKDKKAIAFIIPHGVSNRPLQDYAITIDSLEALSGIDFFEHLDDDPDVEKMEANINISEWKFSEARYKLRVSKWNNE